MLRLIQSPTATGPQHAPAAPSFGGPNGRAGFATSAAAVEIDATCSPSLLPLFASSHLPQPLFMDDYFWILYKT